MTNFISALPSIVPFSFGSDTVNQGSRAQIFCSINNGDRPFKISWSMQGQDLSSDTSISTTQLGSHASMLSIESVDYRHSGSFTCKVTNDAGSVDHTTRLKVNGIHHHRSLEGIGHVALHFDLLFQFFFFLAVQFLITITSCCISVF